MIINFLHQYEDETTKNLEYFEHLINCIPNSKITLFNTDRYIVKPNEIPCIRSRKEWAIDVTLQCKQNKQNFIHFDNGYFLDGALNGIQRITLNSFQKHSISTVPNDRWEMFKKQGVQLHPWKKNGEDIVLCLPTETSISSYKFTPEEWTENILKTLKTVTDRKIIIREKPKIKERRNLSNTFSNYLKSHTPWAVITCLGAVAVESILHGIPVFTHQYNPVSYLAELDFKKIETPRYPNRNSTLRSISYDQFFIHEFNNFWNIFLKHNRLKCKT